MYTHSIYHRILRSGVLITAFLLIFESGVIVPRTAVLSLMTEQYLYANVVSMTASVAPNEVNTLAADLKKKGDELDQREREINAQAHDTSIVSLSPISYILTAILLGQTVLIVLNYFFDYRRARRGLRLPQTVSSGGV